MRRLSSLFFLFLALSSWFCPVDSLVGGAGDYAPRRKTLADDDLLYHGKQPSTQTSSRKSSSLPPTVSSGLKKNGIKKGVDGQEELSTQQSEAIQLIQEGRNVFLTGVAGTGKSLVLKRALEYLKEALKPNEYVALGPTGSAALVLEGQTIHSFAGIGIPRTRDDFEKTLKQKAKWKALKVLVLDEASMVSAEFFDYLSEIVSRIRGDPRPFGGIQLIVCGDFLQLSPIPPRKADVAEMMELADSVEDLFLNRGFLFQAHGWRAANFCVVDLQQVFRQNNREFVQVLDQIRRGHITPSGSDFLKRKCRRSLPPNEFGVRPTILHSKNVNVARENFSELEQLKGREVVYQAIDSVEREKNAPPWADNQLQKNQFFTNCIAEKQLHLKLGAQVMLTKNEAPARGIAAAKFKNKLVNGSRGKIVDFVKLPASVLDSDEGRLPGVDSYPVVQFVCGTKRVIQAETFQSRLVGVGTCVRRAIPLRLAWAITTHKAQGLTLDFVIADVGEVFAEGQTYVALSRASDENGLELRNFSPKRVRANKLALMFYENPNSAFPMWDGSPAETQQVHSESRSLNVGRGKEPREALSSSLEGGKVVVFSGVLRSLSRQKAQSIVEESGGVVRASVSGKTNFLVVGTKNGRAMTAAHAKAKAIVESGTNDSDLQILSEQEFLRLVR
jgi:ATP-dependent DNA helicase PIF1